MRFFMLFLFCFLFATQIQAKSDYTSELEVDVDAQNSVMAKEEAMLQAQRQGFLDVAGRLTSQQNVQKLNELTDDEIAHFISAVSVANEKSGGTKYKALLTVEINGDLLKDYMAENEMIEADVTELLVIPVFRPVAKGDILLMQYDNDWLKMWASKGLIKFGMMQIKTAGNQLEQINGFEAENVLYMGSFLYNEIAQVVGTDKIYVVYAEGLPNGDLKITVKNEKDKTEDYFTVLNDQSGNLLDKAVEKSVIFISNMERKSRNNKENAAKGSLNAVYAYSDMKDWIEKNQAMIELENVENIDTKSMGGGKVNFIINYKGDLDSLWVALQEIGISHEDSDNYVILR